MASSENAHSNAGYFAGHRGLALKPIGFNPGALGDDRIARDEVVQMQDRMFALQQVLDGDEGRLP